MSKQKKYKLIPEGDCFRIQALIDIPEYQVRRGDLGGIIDREYNLPQDRKGWVSKESRVQGDAIVYDAFVSGKSLVADSARVISGIIENSNLLGTLRVKGKVRITDSTVSNGSFVIRDSNEKGVIQNSTIFNIEAESMFFIKNSTVNSKEGVLFEDSVIMLNSILDIKKGKSSNKCSFGDATLKLNELHVGQEIGLFYFKMESGNLSIEGHVLKPDSSSLIRGEKENPIVPDCEHLILCDTKIKGSCSLKGDIRLVSFKIEGMTKVHLRGIINNSTVKDFGAVDCNLSKFITVQRVKLSGDEIYQHQ